MTLFSLFAGSVVLACLCIKIFSPKKVEGYKNRIFYRTLYTVRGFDLIQLVWRLFGKIGAGIITRTIGLGYALSHPATVRAIRSNIALLDPKQATFAAGCRLLMNQAECFSLYGLLLQKKPAAVMEQLGAREVLVVDHDRDATLMKFTVGRVKTLKRVDGDLCFDALRLEKASDLLRFCVGRECVDAFHIGTSGWYAQTLSTSDRRLIRKSSINK